MKRVRASIREASHSDISGLQTILAQGHLFADDLLADGTRYWLAEDTHANPVGVVGLEIGSTAVLLRSAAVSPSFQGQGLGTIMVQHALEAAVAAGYQHIYLFSTDAGSYWQRMNFREVPVSELVAALPEAPQVKQYERLGWLPTEVAWRYDLEKAQKG